MFEIVSKILLFVSLRVKGMLLLNLPLSIVLGLVVAFIPGAGTVVFIVLKLKGLLLVSWWWIIFPIILDLLEFRSIIRRIKSEKKKKENGLNNSEGNLGN